MKKSKVLTDICQTVREDYRGTGVRTTFYGGGHFLRVGFLPQYRRTGYTQYARCEIRRAGRCDLDIVLCDINIVLIDQPIELPDPESLARFEETLDHIHAFAKRWLRSRQGRASCPSRGTRPHPHPQPTMKLNQALIGIYQTICDRYHGTDVRTTFQGDGDHLRVDFLPYGLEDYRRTGLLQYARCDIRMTAQECLYKVFITLNNLVVERTNPKSLNRFEDTLDHILALANPTKRRRKGRE